MADQTFGDGSLDGLRESVDTLLRAAPGAERLLLCLDQAEAIFVLPSRQDRARQLALIDDLRRVDRCMVLLALRADFYGDLMTSVLWPVSRGERVELAPLRGTALRDAIVRPAAVSPAPISIRCWSSGCCTTRATSRKRCR